MKKVIIIVLVALSTLSMARDSKKISIVDPPGCTGWGPRTVICVDINGYEHEIDTLVRLCGDFFTGYFYDYYGERPCGNGGTILSVQMAP